MNQNDPASAGSEPTDLATSDWGRDLDILDQRYIDDPFSIWSALRSECPVPFSERHGRSWMPINYDDISAIAHDTEHFSSCLLYTSPSPRDGLLSRMPSSA